MQRSMYSLWQLLSFNLLLAGLNSQDYDQETTDFYVVSAGTWGANSGTGYNAAREYCQTKFNTELATIDTAAKQQQLAGISTEWYWIGLMNNANGGTRKWSDGTALSYQNWRPNDPSDGDSNGCVEYEPNQGWNDYPCLGSNAATPNLICNKQNPETEKIWVVASSRYDSCDTACSNYNSNYKCELTQQYSMTAGQCGLLWKDDLAGYDAAKHERDFGTELYPNPAAQGSEPNYKGMMPCNLEGNGRLWYHVQKDQGFTLDCAKSDNWAIPLCSCDTGAPIDPCAGVTCTAPDLCTSSTCDPANGQCIDTPITCTAPDDCSVSTCDIVDGVCKNSPKCASNLVCDAGECKRDCNAFQIDEFLTDCSAEFEDNQVNIADLTTRLGIVEDDLNEGGDTEGRLDTIELNVASNDGDITVMQGRLATLDLAVGINGNNNPTRVAQAETDIDALETQVATLNGQVSTLQTSSGNSASAITSINVEIQTIQSELDKFAAYKSEGSFANVISEDDGVVSFISQESMIWILLIMNTIVTIGLFITCVLWRKSTSKYSKYDKVNECSSADDENQLLKH